MPEDAVLDKIPALRLDRSRHAAPQVADALRELIVSLELVPGTVLPRAELAEHYKISQTPVREALIRLGEEGLLDIFPQHATVVSRIDIAAAQQAHFLRRALELEIIRTLTAPDGPDNTALVQRLRRHMQRQLEAMAPQDYVDFGIADRDFHREMYEATGHTELWLLVRQRSGHVDRLRRLHLPAEGKTQSVLDDHRALVEAIEARDTARAEAALRRHLSGTLAFVADIRARYPAYVSG